MRRREFITLLGGSTTWPLAVHAQTERMRRIGVLMAYPEADLEAKALISEFTNSLAVLGWTEGGNLRMDVRWAGSNLESLRKFAKELVDLQPDGALLVGPDNFMDIHHRSIISLAAIKNLPAIYHQPVSARDGGLLSYGADFRDIFHRAARYVASILRGTRPAELPVQMPVKYLLVVNLRTANQLGLTVPPSMLLSADEVIE